MSKLLVCNVDEDTLVWRSCKPPPMDRWCSISACSIPQEILPAEGVVGGIPTEGVMGGMPFSFSTYSGGVTDLCGFKLSGNKNVIGDIKYKSSYDDRYKKYYHFEYSHLKE